MRYKMQLNKKTRAVVTTLLSIVATSAYASDTQFSPVEYSTGNFEQGVNPGLYPPLSSGEASPWQDDSKIQAPDISGESNPWGARPLPATPKPYGVPVAPANPYYGYRAQPQTPYYYTPRQGYGYAPPVYGYAPNYPQVPYGNYGSPFNSTPFGGMPFNNGGMPFSNGGMPFSNGGYNPFGFSMPWSF